MIQRRFPSSILLIALALLGLLTTVELVPNVPLIPAAHASIPTTCGTFSTGNCSVIGMFSESKKSNAVFDPAIGVGSTFAMDVNNTNDIPAGSMPVTQAQIGINWT